MEKPYASEMRSSDLGGHDRIFGHHRAQEVVGRRERMYLMATGLVISTVST